MSPPYGASRDTWLYWDVLLGLGEDLLPVVCPPNLPISPSSALKQYGKVPSRFDREGRVVGFPRWTEHVSSNADLDRWSKDDRLGICLQTRHVRALDVDIEDFDAAQTVRETLDEWAAGHGLHFSYRYRNNSAKFLTLFELEGDYAKQVLHTDHGAIELLMTGQQCVVAGSHPSGVRYDWEGGLKAIAIPTLRADTFDELKRRLWAGAGSRDGWTEGRVRKAREAGISTGVDDPVVDYLIEHEWTTSSGGGGRIDVRCPWADQHTSETDPSSTSYFLAGSGGFECGNFRCLHAHCLGKTITDFLLAIGWMADGFEDISGVGDAGVIETLIDGVPAVGEVPHPLELPRFDRMPKTGKIKPHLNNLLLFLNYLSSQGETIRFDVFHDQIILSYPDGSSRPFTDADYTRLRVRAETGSAGFAPLSKENVRDVVHMVAQDHCFDSAQEWITTLPPWDGTVRIDTFCSTYLGAAPSLYATAVARYLWSAMPGRILKPGIQADMSVILVSAQGTGKSSSIRAIAPMKDYYIDLSLSDRDADLSRLTRGKTLVELSELRGLHTKEMDSIKSFATRLESEWVPKFFEMRTVYLRRFIMMGTTNNDEFLGDATGERRWLPIRVGKQRVDDIRRDHHQLWAEGVHLYRDKGILWQDAQRLAESEHAEFSVQDVWVDLLSTWLHREEFGRRPIDCEFLHMQDVLRDGVGLDLKDGVRANQMRVADAMKRLGYRRIHKWINGRSQKVWIRDLSTSDHLKNEVEMDFF